MSDQRFSRIVRMIGAPNLARLAASRVVVVGLGAVGSYAAEALARAGVGHLRLVDFDEVRPSNINRQLYALHSTIGRPKVEVAAARIADINPDCRVEPLRAFVDDQSIGQVLGEPLDMVIDAIDSLAPKVELLAAVRTRGLPLVASMGAALRTDPALVRVGPLDDVHHCPLAAKIRKRLRKRGVPVDITCVYSIEHVDALHEGAIEAQPAAADVFERGRRRRAMGSLPTLTGIFGLIAANTALRMLIPSAFPASGNGSSIDR